jgi:hypothetical protein
MKKHGHDNNVKEGHNNINKKHRHSSSAMEGLKYKGQHEKKHIHRSNAMEKHDSNARKKMNTIIAQRKNMNIVATQMKNMDII